MIRDTQRTLRSRDMLTIALLVVSLGQSRQHERKHSQTRNSKSPTPHFHLAPPFSKVYCLTLPISDRETAHRSPL